MGAVAVPRLDRTVSDSRFGSDEPHSARRVDRGQGPRYARSRHTAGRRDAQYRRKESRETKKPCPVRRSRQVTPVDAEEQVIGPAVIAFP